MTDTQHGVTAPPAPATGSLQEMLGATDEHVAIVRAEFGEHALGAHLSGFMLGLQHARGGESDAAKAAAATWGMPVETVRLLQPGTQVILLEETSGESADGEERSYPAGTIGEVSEVRMLPAPQGLAATVIIGPQDGEEAIVNVFDEGDPWFPLAHADAVLRLCTALALPANPDTCLKVSRIVAAGQP